MRPRALQTRYLLLLGFVVLILTWTFLFRSTSNRLIIVSNPNFEMSAECTFGTNHVYFYGDNSLDPLIKRWTETNAYRLRYTSHQDSIVIWVRLLERDDAGRSRGVTTNGLVQFPEGGYSHLRARLIGRAGTEMVLPSTGQSRYLTPSSTRGGHVEGWLLQGPLDDQRGSVIQIELPDGIPIGTLNVR